MGQEYFINDRSVSMERFEVFRQALLSLSQPVGDIFDDHRVTKAEVYPLFDFNQDGRHAIEDTKSITKIDRGVLRNLNTLFEKHGFEPVIGPRENFSDFFRPIDEEVKRMFWELSIDAMHARGFHFPPDMEKDVWAFEEGLKHYLDIEFPRRFYSFKTAHALLQSHYELNPTDERPVALLFYPKWDWNGTFERSGIAETIVRSNKFRVYYREISTDVEALRILEEVTRHGQRKVHTWVSAAHGAKPVQILSFAGEIFFGIDVFLLGPLIFLAGHPILSEGHFIDISDFHSGQIDLKRFLVPGGQVFLYSCSNGKGGEDADNLANAVVQVSPKGTRIYSSRVIGNIRSLTVQDDLALKVEWSEGEPYNPIKGLQPF